jgi:ABC-type multidrug transport system fused ATPase/permease subunit
MATSLLDLLGVLLIGLVGALAVTTVQSLPPPTLVQTVTDTLGMSGISDQSLVLVLSAGAALVLLTKSVLSSYLTRRVLVFLANRQALVAARLTRELLSRPLSFLQKRSSQETAYALISGTAAATSLVLGQMVIAVTELSLLLVLGIALLFLSPWVALGAIAFFALVGIGLQRAMGTWASRVGRLSAEADIASLNAIQEALGAYREITVSDRRHLYVDRIQQLRWQAANVAADTQFIGMFPKYLFEAALVLGGFLLAGVLFATQDAVAAVGTLALFLAAGTRVMPSLLRLQGAALGLRSSAGTAGPAFTLAEELGHPLRNPESHIDVGHIRKTLRSGHLGFSPSVQLHDVSFRYPGREHRSITNLSLAIKPGESVALVGPSGAGKSTLADLMLGVLEPESGLARLGGLEPAQTLTTWPGAVAYLPQEILIASDTIRSNVALGLPREAIDDDQVWDALERAHLAAYLRESGQSLDALVGERGMRLSGGQRQRLGIARALFTRPLFLVLDEATSALDAETEQAITQMIDELGGTVTTVVIAHRLSTIQNVDRIVYLNKGQVEAAGTFDSVVRESTGFRSQARLMGLA